MGSAQIYKAKKRLELRLKPKNLFDDGFLITIPTREPFKEDIYRLVQDREEFEKYIKKKVDTFLNFSNF